MIVNSPMKLRPLKIFREIELAFRRVLTLSAPLLASVFLSDVILDAPNDRDTFSVKAMAQQPKFSLIYRQIFREINLERF